MLNSYKPNTSSCLETAIRLNKRGFIDLTGAEFKYGEHCLNILNGRLGRLNPATCLVNGQLSILSEIKPSLFSSRVLINWRNFEFELMMISIQELTTQAELKLKFIARWLPPPESEILPS
jgi:hypothetical protein